eukprot:4128483-Pleurochrysis_carterae.AAC.9
MSQTCQHMYSSNQSLVAHTGSATGSDHSLDAPVVCNFSSNVHDHVGQIKGRESEIKCVASLYAINTAVQSIAVLQPPMPESTSGAVLLESKAAMWLCEDIPRVVLTLDLLRLDGAVGDQLADLQLAAADVL